MTKINLESIKNAMTRNEMRTVKGGCGQYGCDERDYSCPSTYGYQLNYGGGTTKICCPSR